MRAKFKTGGLQKPLVSIITAVRNGRHTLEQTVESVIKQTYPHIEYIVIDGASSDGTLDIIRSYGDAIDYWISEPDQGISDAFNKGISAASGDVIGLLNADDWMSDDQIEQGINALLSASADFVFGDLLFYDGAGKMLYRINGDPQYADIIHSKMPELCHPTVLSRRRAYEKVGLFDTGYHYAMDYEWLLRLHTHGGTGIYSRQIIGHMRVGGASDSSFSKALKEVRDISIRYGHRKFTAYLLYGYRLIKGTIRRILERRTPRRLFDRLRNLFNPRYASTDK